MTSTGLVAIAEAAQALGVGGEQVRRYIERGLLPATKLANVWVLPAAHVAAFKLAPPRGGRPVSEKSAWSHIVEGDVDLGDPHRYTNRGAVTRWSGTVGAVADLLTREGVVVSGIHAAWLHGALLEPLPDEAQVYVAQATMTGVPVALGHPLRGFAPDPIGAVVVRAVGTQGWMTLQQSVWTPSSKRPVPSWFQEGQRVHNAQCAPLAAVALDLALSEHPRERYISEEIMRSL